MLEEKINAESAVIFFRIQQERKKSWKKTCEERNISMTSLIIDSVEQRLMDDERRNVIEFLEKQDNIFAKIETNVNQLARAVNGQKFISESQLALFSTQLSEIAVLKARQNTIFENIYTLLSK